MLSYHLPIPYPNVHQELGERRWSVDRIPRLTGRREVRPFASHQFAPYTIGRLEEEGSPSRNRQLASRTHQAPEFLHVRFHIWRKKKTEDTDDGVKLFIREAQARHIPQDELQVVKLTSCGFSPAQVEESVGQIN